MTLKIQAPYGYPVERSYVLGVVFEEWLGLRWRLVQDDRIDVRITLQEHRGEVRLPDVLFSTSEKTWLKQSSMPSESLKEWDTRELCDDITLVKPTVPVLYGDTQSQLTHKADHLTLPLDIFGSIFFMLSRYEELVIPNRDEHDRFPAWASLAFKNGFLDRPIVDEYVEVLWVAISLLWPRLDREKSTARTFVTCDVDNPYAAYTKCWKGTLLKIGADILKRGSFFEASKSLCNTFLTSRGDYRHDPFWTFDHIMEVNERAGNALAFYFLVDHTVPGIDGHYSPNEPRIRRLMRRIHERGHEIGVHASYATYRNPKQIKDEVERLRRIMIEENICQNEIGCRQHYLRWSSAETPSHLDDAGVSYDTTLSFADYPGFRCGTSREFKMFDHLGRRVLKLRERPLILMECSLLSPKYGNADYDYKTLNAMINYKSICYQFGGNFVLLWHNSYLNKQVDRVFYDSLVTNGMPACSI